MTEKHEPHFSEQTTTDVNYESQPVLAPETPYEQDFPITLSRSLARQLHNLAKNEGIHAFDLLLELVTEGIARRITEDQTRQAPSHLLTRNGYVVDHPNTQPSMSHHEFQLAGNNGSGNLRNKGFTRHNNTSSGQRPNNNRYNNNRSQNNNNYANNNGNNGNTGLYFNKSTKK